MSIDLKQNTSEKTYLYWYEKFGSHKSKRLIQKRTHKKLGRLLIIFLIGIFIMSLYNYFMIHSIDKNGIEATALVKNIIHNRYRSPEANFHNYHIEYEYLVNGNTITKTQEILSEEYDLYFPKKISIGDLIKIKYDSMKPVNSRIEKKQI